MRTFACACIMLLGGSALAQVELVDPDAPGARPPRKPSLDEADPAATPDEEEDDTPVIQPGTARKSADAGVKDLKEKLKDLKPLEAKPTIERPPPPPIATRVVTDADLDLAWQVWRAANEKSSSDIKGEQVARQRLVEFKDEIGATNLETWAVGLLRAAEAHEEKGDSGGAVEIALTATQLAPDLPATWVGLARVYFFGDPSDFGRYLGALKNAIVAQASDPRYARAALADFATTLLFALVLTAVVLLLVLAVRRGFYALYDFHFLFPRVASRWQTGALAVVLLSLPIVFRLGLVPVLLVLFFALALYLTLAERVVVAVLIGLLGLVPTLSSLVVDKLAFAGTRAEALFALERGGTGSEGFAAELTRLASEDKASYTELMALGRYDLRRGRIDAAIKSFRKALTIRPDDPPARINLGMAMVIAGDLENPRALFEEAGKAAPSLAQAPYNLGRLTQRRLAVMGDKVAGEVDRIASALFQARTLDPSYKSLSKDADGTPRSMAANVYLQSVPLPLNEFIGEAKAPDAARRVKSQVQQLLTGDVNETLALVYPGLLALLVLGFGALSTTVHAAKVCNKCGRPVSKRGDPDVSVGSLMCTQCVNVFARKNVAAPSLKVRKQLVVARYQSRIERTGSILGFLCSGMGHVFAGFPARGAFYGFLFIALLIGAVLRNGVLRPPFEPLPLVVRMIPVGLCLVLVYVLTLRGLRKKQGTG
ncbi:MAG: tetratricopeptide repeat protein [Myxococcaceae bacterium]|nr:tetratricopeptide repeat protein [Myxococcaceae bacterium]